MSVKQSLDFIINETDMKLKEIYRYIDMYDYIILMKHFSMQVCNIINTDLCCCFFFSFIFVYQLIFIKLGKYGPPFEKLVRILGNTLMALKDLVLLLFLFIYFSAVFGMNLFGQSYKDCVCQIDEDCQLPRWHMTDFFHAYMNVFRILCGEWIETLWDCMDIAGLSWCIPFYIMVILIGNLLVSISCLYVFLNKTLGIVYVFVCEELMGSRDL